MLSHVVSADGVRIALDVDGPWPPVVLLHGAGSARWAFDLLRPHLDRRFAVAAVDRRGRGDSGDGAEYELQREVDDMVAVLERMGDGATLVGHSYGGLIAAAAAPQLPNLRRLVLYEAPMGGVLAEPEEIDRWERQILSGRADRMLTEYLHVVGGYSESELAAMRGTPAWDRRIAAAPTVPRELRAEHAHRLDLLELARVRVPVLLLVGTESPAWALRSTDAYAEALPHAEVRTLYGHGHAANFSAPELLAEEITAFVGGAATAGGMIG